MTSPKALRLLNLGPTAWARTQSVYRATAELFPTGSPGTVIFCQPLQPYLTHGAQQAAAEAFDLAACKQLGLPVVRRPFAGSAEYCDVNQLLFQWVLPPAEAAPLWLAAAVLAALKECGLIAECDGAQFTVKGARLGTLAGGPCGQAAVFLGCLYFIYDPLALAQARPTARPEHVTALWAEAPRPLSPELVQARLLQRFGDALGRSIERDRPRVEETRRAQQIETELLRTARPWAPDMSGPYSAASEGRPALTDGDGTMTTQAEARKSILDWCRYHYAENLLGLAFFNPAPVNAAYPCGDINVLVVLEQAPAEARERYDAKIDIVLKRLAAHHRVMCRIQTAAELQAIQEMGLPVLDIYLRHAEVAHDPRLLLQNVRAGWARPSGG